MKKNLIEQEFRNISRRYVRDDKFKEDPIDKRDLIPILFHQKKIMIKQEL